MAELSFSILVFVSLFWQWKHKNSFLFLVFVFKNFDKFLKQGKGVFTLLFSFSFSSPSSTLHFCWPNAAGESPEARCQLLVTYTVGNLLVESLSRDSQINLGASPAPKSGSFWQLRKGQRSCWWPLASHQLPTN